MSKKVKKKYKKIKVSHLFSKVIVVYCILYISYAGIVSLNGQRAGASMTEIFVAIAAFFGGELLMTLIRHIFGIKKEEKTYEDSSEQQNL